MCPKSLYVTIESVGLTSTPSSPQDLHIHRCSNSAA